MKKVYLRGALTSISSQRVSYKPYGYTLDFSQTMTDGSPLVFVEIEVPEEGVKEKGDGYIVLSLEGLNAVLQVTADSIDKLNEAHIKKLQEGD